MKRPEQWRSRSLAPIRAEQGGMYFSGWGPQFGGHGHMIPVSVPAVMVMRPKNKPLNITRIVYLDGEQGEQPQILNPGRRRHRKREGTVPG